MTHLLLAGVLIIVLSGSLVLLGVLTMVRELFCDTILEAPSLPDGESSTPHAQQSTSRLSLENIDS